MSGYHYTPEERAQIISLYGTGQPIRKVAAAVGRSYGGTYRVVKEAGILRTRLQAMKILSDRVKEQKSKA